MCGHALIHHYLKTGGEGEQKRFGAKGKRNQ